MAHACYLCEQPCNCGAATTIECDGCGCDDLYDDNYDDEDYYDPEDYDDDDDGY